MKREKGRTPLQRVRITFRRQTQSPVQRIRTTFRKHTPSLITGGLLTALLLLLFGLFSQLPPPQITVQTTDAALIDYSTFLAQVRAGNVLAVTLQGQDMEGVLARPLSRGQVSAAPQTQLTPLQASSAYGTGLVPATASPPLDPAQLVSTRLPESGDVTLIPLLVSKHVVIHTRPPAQLPPWISLLWKFLPFLFLLWMLVGVLFPHRRVQSPGPVDDDKYIKQIRNRTTPARRDSQAPVLSDN